MSRYPTAPAVYVDCPGITNDGKYAHAMRDNCSSCAPFWEQIPICPTDRARLTQTGYCRACKRHFSLEDDFEPSDPNEGLPSYA